MIAFILALLVIIMPIWESRRVVPVALTGVVRWHIHAIDGTLLSFHLITLAEMPSGARTPR